MIEIANGVCADISTWIAVLAPILGYSTSSVYGGGSKFLSGSKAKQKEGKPSKRQEVERKIQELQSEIARLQKELADDVEKK